MDTAPVRPHGPDLLRSPVAWLLGGALLGAVAVIAVVGALRGTTTTTNALTGSGIAATSTRHLPPFRSVELAGSNDVVVHVGGPQAVQVRGDSNLLRFVTTRVHGSTLVIDTRGSFSTRSPMRVDVSAPSLDAIVLSGSGRMDVAGIDARRLSVRLPGSGLVAASGRAVRVDATLAGSGDLELVALSALDANAVVSGSGQIRLRATRSLAARVSGSGVVLYSGNPQRLTPVVTGSGAVVAG